MNTKLLLIIIIGFLFVLFSLPPQVQAQDHPPDSCLKYPIGTDENPYWNPDSVKYDSCHYSETFGQWYATKFVLQFKIWVYIFKTKPFLMDSIYTWEDIDNYHLELKSNFYELTELFGEYHFKRHPIWIDDSSFIEVPTVLLVFDKYILAESLTNYFSDMHLDSIEYVEINQKPVLNSVIEPEKPNKEYTITVTDNDKLNIERKVFDGQGIEIHIYDLMGNLINKYIGKNDVEPVQIDISNLQIGLYFVVINNKYFYKLIKY